MFERFPAPSPRELARLGACAAAGALGLLPGAAGALDAVTLLGWLALAAAPLGALAGASGVALFPFGLAVPAAWSLFLVLALASPGSALAAPAWAACAVAGLFALGFAAGRRASSPARAAGALACAALVSSGLAVGLGLGAGGAELARTRPAAASRLLDASPLVFVYDCAGWDWTHAHAQVYAASGVEWFQRRPWRGNLAAPAVLVVGCLLAGLAGSGRAAARAR